MSSKPAAANGKQAKRSSKAPKRPAPAPSAGSDSDDGEEFRPLPPEEPAVGGSGKPKKKKQKASSSAAQLTDPTLPTPTATPRDQRSVPTPLPSNAAAHKIATVPVLGGGEGEDEEEMDEGEDSGQEEEEVKARTKTEAKAARVWDRPAVSAKSLLPDAQARTPALPTPTSAAASAVAPASERMLAPLATSASSATPGVGQATHRKVIVVLVKAALETVKTKKGYELVTADSHKHVLQKLRKNPGDYRPDILHQCLLTLLDSPLNKAGLLQVYIQTEKNVLIEVHPTIRIPRTFKRFAGLMVQLLHKLKIRSSDSADVLLKVIRGPVTDHLPVGCVKVGTSVTGDLVDVRELASEVVGPNPSAPIVFCVGSHASGPADVDWTDKSVAISKYPLSASVALGRICNAFEGVWNVL